VVKEQQNGFIAVAKVLDLTVLNPASKRSQLEQPRQLVTLALAE
jgi:hypothetical protein